MYRQIMFKEFAMAELKRYSALEHTMKTDLKGLPDGSLVMHNDGSIYRSCKFDGKWMQIRLYEHTKEGKSVLDALRKKKFLKKAISLIENNIIALEKILDSFTVYDPEKIVNSLSAQYRDSFDEYYLEGDISKSGREVSYETFMDNNLIHKSLGGLKTRSKSEAMIATKLEQYNIEFKYEPELNTGKKFLRPDFEIFDKKTRKVVILEHLGMLDNPEYVAYNINKLNEYAKSGFYLGINLFVTYEYKNRPLTYDDIDLVIKNIFESRCFVHI